MKKYLIGSFLFAFVISFIITILIFPQSQELLYMNVGQSVKISADLLVKLVLSLGIQTAILGSIFHFVARKVFLEKQNHLEIK